MKTLRSICAAVVAVSVFTLAAHAADPTGNWQWASVSKANGPAEMTAVIKVKEGVVTGTVTGRQGPAKISDGTFQDGMVTFTVVHKSSAQTVSFKYAGKLEGNTITGTLERPGMDPSSPTTSEWKATRVP